MSPKEIHSPNSEDAAQSQTPAHETTQPSDQAYKTSQGNSKGENGESPQDVWNEENAKYSSSDFLLFYRTRKGNASGNVQKNVRGVKDSKMLSLIVFGQYDQIDNTNNKWATTPISLEDLKEKYCNPSEQFSKFSISEAKGNLTWLFDFYEYVKSFLPKKDVEEIDKKVENCKKHLGEAASRLLSDFEGNETGKLTTDLLFTLKPHQIEKFRSCYFKEIEKENSDFKEALDRLTSAIQYHYAKQCIGDKADDSRKSGDTTREELLPFLSIIRAWLQKRNLFSDSQLDNLCRDCEEVLKNIETGNNETLWSFIKKNEDFKVNPRIKITEIGSKEELKEKLEEIKRFFTIELSRKGEQYVDLIFSKKLPNATTRVNVINNIITQAVNSNGINPSIEDIVSSADVVYKQYRNADKKAETTKLSESYKTELIAALKAHQNKEKIKEHLNDIAALKAIKINNIINIENLIKCFNESYETLEDNDIKFDAQSMSERIASEIEAIQKREALAIEIIKKSKADYEAKLPSLFARGELLQDYADMYSALLTGNAAKPIKYTCTCKSDHPHNRIVFGAPGTGKSHLLDAEEKKLGAQYAERVTFHSDYSYYDFVGSYKPVMVEVNNARTAEPLYEVIPAYENEDVVHHREGGDENRDDTLNDRRGRYYDSVAYIKSNVRKKIIQYSFVPGPFTRILTKALIDIAKNGDNASPHLLIIDEINRARAAAVFGDTFQLLDRGEDFSSRYSVALSEEMKTYIRSAFAEAGLADRYTWKAIKEYKLPSNFYIWATMNSADQGVYPLDTAFKRRWQFEYIGINNGEVSKDNDKKGVIDYPYGELWNTWRKAINEKLKEGGINEDKLLGPFFIDTNSLEINGSWKDEKGERFRKSFVEKVLMYIREDVLRTKTALLFKQQNGHTPHYSDIQEMFAVDTKINEVLEININAEYVTSIESYIKRKWEVQIKSCFYGNLWNTWLQAINENYNAPLKLDLIKEDDLKIQDQENENGNSEQLKRFCNAFVQMAKDAKLRPESSLDDFTVDTSIEDLFKISVEPQYKSISAYFQANQGKSLDS